MNQLQLFPTSQEPRKTPSFSRCVICDRNTEGHNSVCNHCISQARILLKQGKSYCQIATKGSDLETLRNVSLAASYAMVTHSHIDATDAAKYRPDNVR
jgi:hypothetical protein